MLKQYCTLTACLTELRKSDLPVIEKLRLEVQLIQAKRILLDYQVEVRVSGKASSEKEFDELYQLLKSVCTSGGDPVELQRLKDFLSQIKEGLNAQAQPQASHPLHMVQLRKGQSPFRPQLHSV